MKRHVRPATGGDLFPPPSSSTRREMSQEVGAPGYHADEGAAYIERLPDEMLLRIFSFVPCVDRLAALQRVSRRWCAIALDACLANQACLLSASSSLSKSHEPSKKKPCLTRIDVCPRAARMGHLDCLERAHQLGLPWDEWTCAMAALGGHLQCLAFVREAGCAWDGSTLLFAGREGHRACLDYARHNGCPARGLATF